MLSLNICSHGGAALVLWGVHRTDGIISDLIRWFFFARVLVVDAVQQQLHAMRVVNSDGRTSGRDLIYGMLDAPDEEQTIVCLHWRNVAHKLYMYSLVL